MSVPSSRNETVEIPKHIPANLVYDFDYRHDAALIAEPHKRLLEIARTAPPIFFTPRHGGHWVMSSYKAVTEAARTPSVFSSTPRPVEGEGKPTLFLPLMADPPEHAAYRTPLNLVFGTKPMALLQKEIRKLARELVANVADSGKCDFIASIGEPLPVLIFLKLVGLPLDRLPEFREIVKQAHGNDDPEESMRVIGRIATIMTGYIQARRETPEDDLISKLWASEINGRPITFDEMLAYCMLLYTAGLDTVVNAMGFAARHLATDPALQKRLRDDPAQIPFAAEEMLRRYGIVMSPRRVIQDYQMQGVNFREGNSILLVTPTANLDASVFSEPEKYDIDRDNKAHITFLAGPHRCVGSHLARFELHILYEELLAGLPEFRLDPTAPVKFATGNVLSVLSLPIVWDV